jgi:hypothetical protein
MFILYTLSADAAGEDGDTPTDWMLLESITNNGTGESIQQKVFCKIHDGSESSVVITATGAGTGDVHSGRMIAFSGTLDTCSGIVAHTNEQSNSAASDIAHPGLTVSTANTLILAVGGKRACEACAWSTLSGFTEEFDNVTTSGDDQSFVLDYQIQTTATNISSGSFGASAGDETQISVAILLSIKEAAVGAPSFSVAPSCSATTNGVSCTYTASATSTAYGVGVVPADGTPTCTQIKAGQNDAGTAAIWTGSDANTGTADTIAVTGANKPVEMDMHFCLNNAGGDSAVDSSQVNKRRSARSGFAFQTMASHSTTGICNLDSYFNPDCADGDIFEYEDDSDLNADCNVSIEADGDLVFIPVATGDCDGKQKFNISYQDSTEASTGLFTAPTVGNFTTDDLICNGNGIPEPNDEGIGVLLLYQNQAMTPVDLNLVFEDADGDTLTFTETGPGTIPAGTSLGGTGNKDWTGTPTTEDENGEALTFTATDECGDFGDFDLTVYVTDGSVTTPDVVNDTIATAVSELQAVRPWLASDEQLSATFAYSGSVAANLIISQNPTASSTLTAIQALQVVVSLGPSATVPNLIGQNITAVPGLLSGAGLVRGTITYQVDQSLYTVLAQYPPASSTVAVGSAVDYTVGVISSNVVDEPSRPR